MQAVQIHDIYWAGAPKSDPHTIFVWQFDSQGEATSAELDAMLEEELDALGDGGGEPAAALPAVQSQIKYALAGGAEEVGGGRYGGGLALRGGTATSDPVDLRLVLRSEGALTVDFWLRVEGAGAAGTLLTLADLGKQTPVCLRLEAGGSLTAAIGSAARTHPQRLAPGCWTHVAVVLRAGARGVPTVCLGVNGRFAEVDGSRAQRAQGLAERLADTVVLGAGTGIQLDAVRLSKRERFFYEWGGDSLAEANAERPLASGPPYFVREGLSVYCPFDGRLAPDVFAGGGVPGKAEESFFGPGVRGQALDLSRIDETGFALPGYSVWPDGKGAMEFWFRPKDWNNFFVGGFRGEGVTRQPLLLLTHAKGARSYQAWKRVTLLAGRAGQDASKPWTRFHPGTWTHVVITWTAKAKHGTVYINGERQSFGQVAAALSNHLPAVRKMRADWEKQGGDKDDGTYQLVFHASPTLIDELRIYPWTLSPEEAWNAYARYLPDAAQRLAVLPPIKVDFEYQAHNWDNRKRLRVHLSCLPSGGIAPATAQLTLRQGDASRFADKAVPLDENGRATVVVEQAFDFGEYAVQVASFGKEGQALERLDTTYARIKPVWHGNALGKARTVPAPWEPMVVSERTVRVWGREVTIGPGGLPEAIKTLGRTLTAAPATLSATVGGKAVSFTPGAVRITEAEKDRVAWESTLTGGSVAARVSAWMEYDGLVYYTVRLVAPEPVEVEALDVSFPLAGREVSQLIGNTGGGNFRASWDIRMLAKEEGSIWSSLKCRPKIQRGVKFGNFFPQIWVGGDDIGLSFSGDNDRGWTPDDKTPAQEVVRRGETVEFQMHVIRKPVTVEKERVFSFILLPTPAKPEPQGWRGWNRMARGTPNASYDVIDDFNGFPLKADPDNPQALNFAIEPASWEAAAKQHKSLTDKFGAENPVFIYIDYSWPRPGESFADWNHDLWAGTGRIAWLPEFEDYMVWAMNEYLERGLIDGIYIDDTSMGRTYSLQSTAYPIDWDLPDLPKRRVGFNTMGARRFCQRMWKLFRAKGKEPHILPHMTYCFELPLFSFCNAIVNGEARMIGLASKRDTMDNWSRATLRIMGNAPKWGVATFWKPTVEVSEGVPKALEAWHYRQCRTLQANVMQADMWYLWTYPTARVILPSLLEFDMRDPAMRFLPYWKNDGVTTVAGPASQDLVVGLFVKREKGHALLMLSNFAREDQEATLALDVQKLFGTDGTVRWRDADCSLQPPKELTASAADIAAAETKMRAGGAGLGGDDEDLGEEDLESLLEEQVPAAEQEQQRLAIQADGNTVRLVVRKRDYRLLDIRLP